MPSRKTIKEECKFESFLPASPTPENYGTYWKGATTGQDEQGDKVIDDGVGGNSVEFIPRNYLSGTGASGTLVHSSAENPIFRALSGRDAKLAHQMDFLFETMKDNINGLHCMSFSNLAGEHRVTISNGSSMAYQDSTGSYAFVNTNGVWSTTGFTKDLFGAAYAFGNNQCGRAPGVSLTNDTWYHVFLILRSTGGIDLGFDTDVVGQNFIDNPGDITHLRRIASLYYVSDGTVGLRHVFHLGDYFFWKDVSSTYSSFVSLTVASPSQDLDITKWVPPGVTSVIKVGVMADSHTVNLAGIRQVQILSKVNASSVIRPQIKFPITTSQEWQGLAGADFIVDPDNKSLTIWAFGLTGTEQINVYIYPQAYVDTRGRDWGSGPAAASPRGLFF